MRIHLMKNIKYDNFDESNSNFDQGPEEPEYAYNPCECCFFRLSTIERSAKDVQKLRGGAVRMSIEALLLFLSEKQGNNTRYLRDINRRPDTWQTVQHDAATQPDGQGVV